MLNFALGFGACYLLGALVTVKFVHDRYDGSIARAPRTDALRVWLLWPVTLWFLGKR